MLRGDGRTLLEEVDTLRGGLDRPPTVVEPPGISTLGSSDRPSPRSPDDLDPIEPPRRELPGTAWLTLAAGSLFVVVPLLVEFVSGDAFV